MSRFGLFVVLLLFPLCGGGQITGNSVTVTATQGAAPQPDLAVFSITVTSGIDKNLGDIVGALPGSGITAANFASLSSSQYTIAIVNGGTPPAPTPQPQLVWGFQIVVPLSKVKDTTAALAALAQTVSKNDSGLSLTFSMAGTQVSPQQNATCSLPDLIASARGQAQQLTASAGLTLGMIQAITGATPSLSPCFLTVRFALGTQLMSWEPNSITVAASRSLPVQPDQFSISLNVSSDLNAALGEVTTALQQAGISGATFEGVNTVPVFVTGPTPATQSHLQWTFGMTAPLSQTKDTLATITAAQQALAKTAPGLTLTFFVAGVLISPQLAASQTCPNADLVKDAQTQAQSLASAAGVSLGSILSLSGGNAPSAIAPAFRLGQFVASPGFISVAAATYAIPSFPPGCSMTVSFHLL